MQATILLVLSTVLMAADSELDKLKGSWEAISFTIDGMERKVDSSAAEFKIEGDKVTQVNPNGTTVSGTISVDPSKNPKEYDLQFDPFRNGVKSPLMRGIYDLNGDILRMCCTWSPDRERPRFFKAEKGDSCRITIYKRKKSGANE
jgi:uncharacterized protein (TIGR03067 family)